MKNVSRVFSIIQICRQSTTVKTKEIERREKKEKTSSEARKPIIDLNCTKSLMGEYSDGKKGVRDCTYDFNYFWQRIILLNSNEGSAGVQLHLNCLNCMGWQMNADLFGSVTFSLYKRFDEFSRNLAIFPISGFLKASRCLNWEQQWAKLSCYFFLH